MGGFAQAWSFVHEPALLGVVADSLSVFDPASKPAADIRDMFLLVLAITGGICVVVEGMLIYCIWRFRSKPSDSVEPPQVYGSRPIEVAWTVAPLLIVFVMFLVVVRTAADVRQVPENAATTGLRVTVIGRQWWWEYVYEGYRTERLSFRTANELVVPVDTPVVLDLQSADVIHSFWVPRLAGKTDVIPGRTNRTWFQARHPGSFLGQCAEYCGTQHGNMLLRVEALPADEFERWLANQKQPAREVEAVRAGREAFRSRSCVNCHTIRGVSERGTAGPDLTHLMSRKTIGSGMVFLRPDPRQNKGTLPDGADPLTAWVTDPQKIKPGCLMPAFHLSRSEFEEIVAYFKTLE